MVDFYTSAPTSVLLILHIKRRPKHTDHVPLPLALHNLRSSALLSLSTWSATCGSNEIEPVLLLLLLLIASPEPPGAHQPLLHLSGPMRQPISLSFHAVPRVWAYTSLRPEEQKEKKKDESCLHVDPRSDASFVRLQKKKTI